jgi:hypothetical protein
MKSAYPDVTTGVRMISRFINCRLYIVYPILPSSYYDLYNER